MSSFINGRGNINKNYIDSETVIRVNDDQHHHHVLYIIIHIDKLYLVEKFPNLHNKIENLNGSM